MANHIELTHEELQRRIEILKKQDFYKGKSYFPELKSKSIEERFEDCVEQIKEYGWPDFNYMVYGMDVKTSDESHKYVNGMEFVYRRNYLNFERNNFNSCCLLRNKLYFGIFAKSIGIKTPKDLALIENGKILNISEKFKEISNMEFLALSDDMFCKSLDGENGVGVFHLQVQGGQFLVNGNVGKPCNIGFGRGIYIVHIAVITLIGNRHKEGCAGSVTSYVSCLLYKIQTQR